MVFNSIFFIFCFLPVFMLIYYLVPGKLRNLILFLGSLVFYAWGEPVYVILMLFSSIFNYYMGAELEQHTLTDADGNSVTVTQTTNGDYYFRDDNGTGFTDNGDGTWSDENGNNYTEN